MKLFRFLMPVLLLGLMFTSCSKEDDVVEQEPVAPVEEANLEVEEFIFAGMSNIYLYKADVPELTDGYYETTQDKRDFLMTFDSPEKLYQSLKSSQDKFSFMTSDYVALENRFSGVASTNGMQLAYYRYGTNEILAIVNYVLPNTSAEEKGIIRGNAFTQVDGQQLTEGNYRDLTAPSSYTITLAEIQENGIVQTEETITLSKEEYNTNPVYVKKTFDLNGITVGYLMYNSFTADYDEHLNTAFADLKASGVTELVLDLRYNGGGSVATAVGLAGMITGQFNGEIFSKQQWNDRYQNAWDEESYIDRFRDKITLDRGTDNERDVPLNSLGLDQVYILTTKRSASASELVINGLKPYIDVIQVGGTTTGKFQASVTLYDSPNFRREGASENHTYAIQPLIYKSSNAKGVTDYINGLEPTIAIGENLREMGVLGDETEPLLKAALNDIQNLPQDEQKAAAARKASEKFGLIGETGMENLDYQRMYIDKLPEGLIREE